MSGAPTPYGRSRCGTAGRAWPYTTIYSGGRASCWRVSRRVCDRSEGERVGPAAGQERGVQGVAPGPCGAAGTRNLPAVARRSRAHRPGYGAGDAGGARACEGSGGAVRSRPAERPGEFGVSAGRGGAGEFREVHGQGERAHLRGYEAGVGEPHHHPGLMGVFIVVEGPEGAGKSTLVRWLAARLVTEGLQVTAVRQPGGTPVAGAARKVALKFPHEMSPVAELFLFLAARADLVQRVIRPALEAGQVVVADRFDLSTIAYQVAGGGLPAEDVAHAIRLATGGLVPDVMLVLDVPVEVGRARQRAARKVQDRFERQDDAFHRRVLDAYRRAAGPGVVHIDATQSKKSVQDAAWREVMAGDALSTPSVS